MFFRYWERKGKFFGSIVKSVRNGKKITQETVVYLGEIEEAQIPYFKACYAKVKPKLLYPDGTLYEDKNSKS